MCWTALANPTMGSVSDSRSDCWPPRHPVSPLSYLLSAWGAEVPIALSTTLLSLLLCCVVNLQMLANCQDCSILLIIFCQECHLLKPWPPFLFIIVSAVSLVVRCVIFWSLAHCFLFPYSASGKFPIF